MKHTDEVWQEVGCNGERIGGVLPSELGKNKENLWSGAGTVLYRYKDGEVEFLFQHRSKGMRDFPDRWDISAGGHVNLGESNIAAAVRETREEIGAEVDINKLEFAATYRQWDALITIYFYDWGDREDEFCFDDEEVEEVKWVKYSELDDFWSNVKQNLAEDKIFRCCLEKLNSDILEKQNENL